MSEPTAAAAAAATPAPETSLAAPATGGAQTPTVLPAAPAALAAPAPRQLHMVVTSDIALMDTAQFEHMQRIATLMSKMDLLPVHLRARPWFYPKKKTDNLAPAEVKEWREKLGLQEFDKAWALADQRTVANCILVVDQALRWGMNPFATMGETYEIGGKLASQGKLVAAVINARAPIERRLDYTFVGEGDERTVTVSATFKGDTAPKKIDLKLKDAKTDNDMWKSNPDQKLIYSGVMIWARRWCPEIVLGIQTDDDIERGIAEERAREPRRVASSLDAFAAPALLPAAAAESSSGRSALDDRAGGWEAAGAGTDQAPAPAAVGAAEGSDPPPPQATPQPAAAPSPPASPAAPAAAAAPLPTLPAEVVQRLAKSAKQAKVPSDDLARHLGVQLPAAGEEIPFDWLFRLPIPEGKSVTDFELEITRAIQAQAKLFGRRP